MSSVTPVGGTSALIGSISDAQPAATSASCTSCTPRTCRQISQTPTSPHAWPAGTGGGPVAVEHLHELHAARADRRRAARLEHRDARARRAAGERLEARQLAGVVEEHAVEADVAAVEVDRRVDVADADADVVDPLEGAHAASTASAQQPGLDEDLAHPPQARGVGHGQPRRRTSPPGWPSIFISALSWLW